MSKSESCGGSLVRVGGLRPARTQSSSGDDTFVTASSLREETATHPTSRDAAVPRRHSPFPSRAPNDCLAPARLALLLLLEESFPSASSHLEGIDPGTLPEGGPRRVSRIGDRLAFHLRHEAVQRGHRSGPVMRSSPRTRSHTHPCTLLPLPLLRRLASHATRHATSTSSSRRTRGRRRRR